MPRRAAPAPARAPCVQPRAPCSRARPSAALAQLLADAGEYEQARPLFDKLTAMPHPRPYTYQCYAALEQAAEQPEAARELYERGAALKPREMRAKEEMVPLLHAWAVLEWKLENRSVARKLFEQAEAAATTPCGWLYQWHARFEADGGNAVLARHYYARAVNTAPRDSSAWRMWCVRCPMPQSPPHRSTLGTASPSLHPALPACLLPRPFSSPASLQLIAPFFSAPPPLISSAHSLLPLRADLEESLNQTERASAFMRRSLELEAEEWLLHSQEGGSPLRRRHMRTW